MIEETDAVIIEDVLREVMPEDCSAIGKTNLRDIVHFGGDIHLVPLDGASKLDLSVSMALAAAGAAILSHGLNVIKNLSDGKKKNLSEISIEIKLSMSEEMARKLKPAMLEKLLEALINRLPR